MVAAMERETITPNTVLLDPDQKSPRKERIYFLRRLPADPLTEDGRWGLRSYASPPTDPSEGEDVFDVYSLAPGAGINGRPYRDW